MGVAAPTELQTLVLEERNRGRFSVDNVRELASVLGFGRDGALGVEFGDDVPDDFVGNAWREAAKKNRREANEALNVLAQFRGSKTLMSLWESEKNGKMDLEKALSTLDVPRDIDEGILITVYSMRVSDPRAPSRH